MPRFEAEVPGQPAATRVQDVQVDAGRAQQRLVRVVAHDGVLVAVGLGDRIAAQVRRLPAVGVVPQQFGERDGLLPQPLHVAVAGHQLARVGPEHRRAARFQPDDPGAAPQVRGQRVDAALQHPPGRGQLAGGDPGQAAAQRLAGHDDPPAGRLQHLDRRAPDPGGQVIGEGVRPQYDFTPQPGKPGIAAGRPGLQRLTGEQRDAAAPVDPAHGGQRVAQDGCLGDRVDQPRGPGGDLGHRGQPAHRVVRPRAQAAGVVVGQELGLHGGHVDLDRAVLLAALAGQAQVQRVADLGGPPARRDRGVGVPLQHLEQQPAPAAGGVLLLAGDHVRRAHHPPAHLPPPFTRRHLPTPTHRITARSKRPSSSG